MYGLLSFWAIFELFTYYQYKVNKRLKHSSEIYPYISDELIKKFNSFDPELGWVNQKNTIKKDRVKGREVTYTFGKYGDRISPLSDTGYVNKVTISTYGDSFCQCREVEDNETWQYYLTKKSGCQVFNYGVGNYGIDQALMRLQKEYDLNPTDIVILQMVPHSIQRILSVWKHINEHGLILNTKPRYLVENGKLKKVPLFISEKQEIQNIKYYKSFLKKYDYFYKTFKHKFYSFPYIYQLLYGTNIDYKYQVLYPTMVRWFRRLKSKRLEILYINKLRKVPFNKFLHLYTEKGYLLLKIIDEFKKFSQEKNFKPVLLITITEYELEFKRLFNQYSFEKTIKEIQKQLNLDVVIWNPFDILERPIEDYFITKGKKHQTALNNRMLAEQLYKKLGLQSL